MHKEHDSHEEKGLNVVVPNAGAVHLYGIPRALVAEVARGQLYIRARVQQVNVKAERVYANVLPSGSLRHSQVFRYGPSLTCERK